MHTQQMSAIGFMLIPWAKIVAIVERNVCQQRKEEEEDYKQANNAGLKKKKNIYKEKCREGNALHVC